MEERLRCVETQAKERGEGYAFRNVGRNSRVNRPLVGALIFPGFFSNGRKNLPEPHPKEGLKCCPDSGLIGGQSGNYPNRLRLSLVISLPRAAPEMAPITHPAITMTDTTVSVSIQSVLKKKIVSTVNVAIPDAMPPDTKPASIIKAFIRILEDISFKACSGSRLDLRFPGVYSAFLPCRAMPHSNSSRNRLPCFSHCGIGRSSQCWQVARGLSDAG